MRIFTTHKLASATLENLRRRRWLAVILSPLALPFTVMADSVVLAMFGAPLFLTWLFSGTSSKP